MHEFDPDAALPELNESPKILEAVNAVLARTGDDLTQSSFLLLACVANPRNLVSISCYPPIDRVEVDVRTALSDVPTDREVLARRCSLELGTGIVDDYYVEVHGGRFMHEVVSVNDPQTLQPINVYEGHEIATLAASMNRFTLAEETLILGFLDQV